MGPQGTLCLYVSLLLQLRRLAGAEAACCMAHLTSTAAACSVRRYVAESASQAVRAEPCGCFKVVCAVMADCRQAIVKVPMTLDGLKAISVLSKEGIRCNCTLVFSANQALMAARAGAYLVSPFVGRLDDIGHDGMQVCATGTPCYTSCCVGSCGWQMWCGASSKWLVFCSSHEQLITAALCNCSKQECEC